MLYVVIAVIAVVLIYFLFFRKKEDAPEQVGPSATPPKKVPPKAAPAESPGAPSTGATPEASPPPPPARRPSVPPARPSAPPPVAQPSRPPLGERDAEVQGLRRGLSKARSEEGIFGRLKALLGGKREIDASIANEIEEVLLTSDVGVETTALLIARVKDGLAKGELSNPDKVWDALRGEALRVLEGGGAASGLAPKAKPTVVLLVGVNGAGKTTTIGKLATKLHGGGSKVVLAAGDTFRAAAVQQLVVWGQRVGCEVVRGKDGADPGSVLFEAIKKAQETGADFVLADTAGRLHTKTNLMAEMKKIAKTAEKALPDAPHETFLVLDATNGQNALAQAREFKETLNLTGIVLTKLDGTAKGGVVLAIADALRLPVRFVGLGERAEDLREFQADAFVEALLGREADKDGSA
jgi:fused signal recognition particle receptor